MNTMDIDNLIRASILISLLIAFIGIVIWAWSNKRHEDFEIMGRLPLDEDDAQMHKTQERS